MGDKIKNGVFLLVTISLIVSLTKNIIQYTERLNFFSLYEKQLQNERLKNSKLKSTIAQNSDYYSVEEVIREKLNKTLENEYVVILPSNKTTIQSIPQQIKPSYRQWIDLFFY